MYATFLRLSVAAAAVSGAAAIATSRACANEIYVSWHGGGSSDGLEYALVSPVKDTTTAAAPRLFKDAEAYCSRLGGGAHLGSIQTEDEKNRINQAFTAFPFFADLKSVWIGLSNLDPGTGQPTKSWHWTDGRPFEGKDFAEWNETKNANGPSDGLVPSCVYVDTVNNFKWTVANCNTYKLPELLCERYEDKCASDANTCAVKSSCINQLDGDLYCACKDSEQVSANGKTCETCQDGSCTFKVGPGTKSQAIPSPKTSMVVRTKLVPHDQMISETGIQVAITTLKHNGPADTGCPRVEDSLVVRHVDSHSGEYTQCWNDANKELVFDLRTPCRNGDKNGLTSVTKMMQPGNPCAGKVGGRIELMATEVVDKGTLLVVNPMLTLGKTVTPANIKCYQCGDADWVVAENGLEYHLLDDGTSRTFIEAEQACQKLGGGAHLGSITDESEKFSLNRAFSDRIKYLGAVWFGLTNYDQYSKSVVTDGSLFWTDGQDFAGQEDWWSWKAGVMPASFKTDESCTWVDTKDNYKWGVSDCTTEKKQSAVCERFEDACTASSAFSSSGGCSGSAICLNQLNGQYYCSCPAGKQLGDWVPKVGAHECVPCSGGTCTFDLVGHGGGESSNKPGVDQQHQESQVVRHVTIQSDHSVQSLSFKATLVVPESSACPTTAVSLGVRHVDAYSGEYTICGAGSPDSFSVDLRSDGACQSARKGKSVSMTAAANNPCIGKVGGRFELVGNAFGSGELLTVQNPELIHTLSDGPVPDTCVDAGVVPGGSTAGPKKKTGPLFLVVVLLVLVLVIGGVYAIKGHYGRPTVHYSIQVNADDDDDDLEDLDGL